jgi:hypothetical protein
MRGFASSAGVFDCYFCGAHRQPVFVIPYEILPRKDQRNIGENFRFEQLGRLWDEKATTPGARTAPGHPAFGADDRGRCGWLCLEVVGVLPDRLRRDSLRSSCRASLGMASLGRAFRGRSPTLWGVLMSELKLRPPSWSRRKAGGPEPTANEPRGSSRWGET